MNISIVVIILITLSSLANAEEEEKEENRDAQDEYSSIELGSPRSSDASEEDISSERYDGIVDIDDIIKSSEFNKMFYPGTIQVRRFAAPLKDHSIDDIFKDAKVSKHASGEKNKRGKEDKKIAKEMYKSAKKEEKSGKKEEKGAVNEETNGMNDEKSAINEEESAMNEGKSAMNGEKSAINEEKSAINEEKSATNEDKSAMNGEKSAINEEKSAMNEEKSAINGEKSATNDDKSAMNPEKNVMNEYKSGNQSGVGEEKSGTEKEKSAKPQEDNKSEDDMSKTAEENIKTGQEKERRALKLVKDRSALPGEEAKRGGIIDIKASRRDNDEPEDKADDSPKRSLNTADVFDDMDDLISPYFLEKFRNTYEDDNYDRSQYVENQEERYDDDLADDDLSDISERPNRRMFGSAPIPDFNIEKPQIIKPSFDSFSTPKPFIGNIMPSPPFLQPMMRPPLPYINKINQLSNSNIRLPPQHPLFNKFQQPFPKQNFNILGNRDSGYGAPNFNAYDHNYNDINEYPYTPVSETSRIGQPPMNPIFKKLAQASNSPRPMPILYNFKLPMRPVTLPPHVRPRFNIPTNFNPYLFRYKRSLHHTT